MTKHKKRVVVTGVGAITPAGRTTQEMWEGLKKSKSSVSKLTLFNSSTFKTKIAAEVKKFNFEKEFQGYKKNSHLDQLNRHAQFALMAAWEAYHDSGLDKNTIDPEKFGVYFASGEGGVDFVNFAKEH